MLLLIVLAHAPLFLYNAEPGVMSRPENITFIDTIVNTFGELFIDNRARPLFAVLFGYGLMMIFEKQILRGNSQKAALKTIRRRCWYLILFGIIFAVVIGGQDILMAYGIAGLLTAWLLPRNNKALIKVTIFITLIILLYLPLLWGVFFERNGQLWIRSGSYTGYWVSAILYRSRSFFSNHPDIYSLSFSRSSFCSYRHVGRQKTFAG